MGYEARGGGWMKLRKDVPEDLIENLGDVFEVDREWGHADGEIDIDVSYDRKFYPEDIEAVLKELSPYTCSGEIEMTGEADCHWRYRYSEKYQKWVEENGYIVYEEYEKDKDYGTASIPVYALVVGSDIIREFTDEKAAEKACAERNELAGTEGYGGGGLLHKVVRTKLEIG